VRRLGLPRGSAGRLCAVSSVRQAPICVVRLNHWPTGALHAALARDRQQAATAAPACAASACPVGQPGLSAQSLLSGSQAPFWCAVLNLCRLVFAGSSSWQLGLRKEGATGIAGRRPRWPRQWARQHPHWVHWLAAHLSADFLPRLAGGSLAPGHPRTLHPGLSRLACRPPACCYRIQTPQLTWTYLNEGGLPRLQPRPSSTPPTKAARGR
jgi:hypothetical protein